MKTIGEKIYELRIAHDMTQKELAEAIDVTPRAIINYETKGAMPRGQKIHKMCQVFQVSMAYLTDPEIEDPNYRKDEAPYVETVREKYGSKGARELESLLHANQTMFAGGDIPQEDKDAFFDAVMEAYLLTKQKANDKFNPKKYK